ncbi:MAG: hypothetical protein AAF742_07115 [Pseudomonadota bacterium]
MLKRNRKYGVDRNFVCPLTGEVNPEKTEIHHIGRAKFSDDCIEISEAAHTALTDMQMHEHPKTANGKISEDVSDALLLGDIRDILQFFDDRLGDIEERLINRSASEMYDGEDE